MKRLAVIRRYDGKRINFTEGVLLFEKGELGYLGALANFVREKKNGDNTYFNRNFHIEPTNLCIYTCKFCSYSRLIKQRGDESWEYTMDDMLNIVKSYDGKPVTEVHLVGGVLPQYDLPFYLELFSKIKAHRPELHVKALTPVEYHYIFKKAKVSYGAGLNIGNSWKRQDVELDLDLVVKGLKDALSGIKPQFTEQEISEAMKVFNADLQAKREEKRKQLGEKNKTDGAKFLAENRTKPGVFSLESGLQCKVIKDGNIRAQ